MDSNLEQVSENPVNDFTSFGYACLVKLLEHQSLCRSEVGYRADVVYLQDQTKTQLFQVEATNDDRAQYIVRRWVLGQQLSYEKYILISDSILKRTVTVSKELADDETSQIISSEAANELVNDLIKASHCG